MNNNMAITEINNAEQALARGDSSLAFMVIDRALEQLDGIHGMVNFRNKASAANLISDAQGLKERAQLMKIAQLKAERRAGTWLDENLPHGGDRKSSSTPSNLILDDVDVSPYESTNWRLEASLPEAKFNAWIDQSLANGWEISAAGLRKVAANKTHVSFNTGESEWYTPPEYIAAARAVMGRIDLDPASSEIANEIVGATLFHTVDDSGLNKFWAGKVWMNPPYSIELITRFVSKYIQHVKDNDISEGIVLVNNATETKWFGGLVSVAKAIVFTTGRIKYLNTQLLPANSPLQGQAILYAGDNPDKFIAEFSNFGWSAKL